MKRLVVCLDGTWNTPDDGDNPTNVVKIMRAIRPSDDEGVKQIVFYDKGVGTGGPIDKLFGGAFGKGLDENILDGYRFLANNLESDDEIYLFGFSRGAFTARSLAGFIGRVGLLEKGQMERLPLAWKAYRQSDEALRDMLKAYGRTDVKIKCVGVWDTVGALGIPIKLANIFTRGKYKFHDTELGEHIEYAFHALAIDEKRGPFRPTLWDCKKGASRPVEEVEQVWFAGVHSNVGGSTKDASLPDMALDWMIKRVKKSTKLAFINKYRDEHINPNHLGTLNESLDGYFLSRVAPLIRTIGGCRIRRGMRLLNRFPRLIFRSNHPKIGNEYVNEMIHRSPIDRFGREAPYEYDNWKKYLVYEPANLKIAKHKLPIVAYDGTINPAELIEPVEEEE